MKLTDSQAWVSRRSASVAVCLSAGRACKPHSWSCREEFRFTGCRDVLCKVPRRVTLEEETLLVWDKWKKSVHSSQERDDCFSTEIGAAK